MRKAIAAAFAALVGMSISAQAADIYEGSLKDDAVYAPAPVWTGLYIGGHLGGLWNDSGDSSAFKGDWDCYKKECKHWNKVKQVKFKDDDDNLSLLGGVHLGYNWQNGARVYGVEGDLSFADGVDYLASLRARLGHLLDDNLLVYATAGVAFVGFEDKVINHSNFGGKTQTTFSGGNDVGLVVGGGIERKLTPNMSIGLEGLYYFFDDAEFSKTWKYGDWCKMVEHEDDNDLFVVRARLSYSLQRDEPALDSYK